MDVFRNGFILVFTIFTYVVTANDMRKLIQDSFKYGILNQLQILWVRMLTGLLPAYLRKKLKTFSDDDIDIQIRKLNRNKKREQINALGHLEQILKFLPTTSADIQDFEKIQRIQRAIFKVLWYTKTDGEVIKKAIDMLCKNDHLRGECGCDK